MTLHVGLTQLHGATAPDRDVIINWLRDVGVNTGQATGFEIDDEIEPHDVLVSFRSVEPVTFVCAPPAPMAAVRRVASALVGEAP